MIFQTLAPAVSSADRAYQTLDAAFKIAEKQSEKDDKNPFPSSAEEMKKLTDAAAVLGKHHVKNNDDNSPSSKFTARLSDLQVKFERSNNEAASAVVDKLGKAFITALMAEQ